MATIGLSSFEVEMSVLILKLQLAPPVSRELMIAAFEAYGVMVRTHGAIEMVVGLQTDTIGPGDLDAAWYVLLKDGD